MAALSPTAASTWAPLRSSAFRALWTAQFVANTGTWAQIVGAQWLMGDLHPGSLWVALVQTASTLPVFLLVVPAGALGDILDRRRLLLASQSLMLSAAAALAILTALDATTPVLLLALIAVMGVGQALSVPSFQAIQPELVRLEEIPQAALLNGANVNVARAVGPAIGGALIAIAGPEATFALNALSFVGVLLVLYRWERLRDHRPLGGEHVLSAIRAGARYVRSAPAFGIVLLRSALFMLFASGLWALLPAIARGPLGLGAGGYGVLLGSLGVGAVVGAVVVPPLRRRCGTNALVAAATVAYAATMLVVGLVASVPLVIAALLVGGLAWIAVQSSLNAAAQTSVPGWARARALAYWQLVFMGGQALGALLWGAVAQAEGHELAFAVPACALVVGTVVALRPLALQTDDLDLRHSRLWDDPTVALEPAPDSGPVLVTVEWRIDMDDAEAFIRAMRPVGLARRRTGATLWGLFRDTGDPTIFLETFTVSTWREHLRQHLERGTAMDEEIEAQARRFHAGEDPPRVEHLIWAFDR